MSRLLYHAFHCFGVDFKRDFLFFVEFFIIFSIINLRPRDASAQNIETELDKRVLDFLQSQRQNWHDWNVPYDDGRVLYDIIIKNGYTKALEIGTSTGHSSIWIAWALSKTGGKLITLEIDAEAMKSMIEQAGHMRSICHDWNKNMMNSEEHRGN